MSGPKIICEYDALLSKAAVRIFAKFEAAFTNFALLDAAQKCWQCWQCDQIIMFLRELELLSTFLSLAHQVAHPHPHIYGHLHHYVTIVCL